MTYTAQDFIKELDLVVNELRKEIKNRKAGIKGDGSVGQLEFFLDELEQIRNKVLSNAIPPKAQRYVAYTWYITDSWDLTSDSLLRKMLMNLADKYKRRLV